ncbi:exosortase A [Pseudopontixanthobacter vadosimaris]|uniref:exosortase A n=1 Tax=Pseudopontixanthobacter vadosimaris TaxID=2726450 RepID=UPI001F0E24CC|nr:exosortase A [Pseudopontixanthobacter vadosimaris]
MLPAAWRAPLATLAAVWLAVFLVTWREWLAMFGQWWNSSTYNHILFVPLILAWLVWHRREELLKLPPEPWWPGLFPFAGALFVWLVGSVSGFDLFAQSGAVGALIIGVMVILGPRIAAGLALPLGYMLFLIPFGDELVPALQMVTAEIVIWLTEASGIPAEIEGVFIDTPVGLFEVAEACSGVKFLVAMTALGVLVAATCFRRWRSRLLFMAVALSLPIVANGIRAWATIYIAQSQGIAFAEGFDHIFYGWVFFAIIMFLLLAIAWRWAERHPDDAAIDPEHIMESQTLARMAEYRISLRAALLGSLVVVLAFVGWNLAALRVEAALPDQVYLPGVKGWQAARTPQGLAWQPRAGGADHRLLGRYANVQGQAVDVSLAIYAKQTDKADAAAFGEGALPPDTPWRWVGQGEGTGTYGSENLFALGRYRRLAQTSYYREPLLTGSALRLKLATMRDRLLLRPNPTATLILSAEERQGRPAAELLADFRRAIGSEGAWMDGILQSR